MFLQLHSVGSLVGAGRDDRNLRYFSGVWSWVRIYVQLIHPPSLKTPAMEKIAGGFVFSVAILRAK